MKKTILFLLFIFNLLPVIEKGRLVLSGPFSSYAQTNGEEEDDYYDEYFEDYYEDYGDIGFDTDIAYSVQLPEIEITGNSTSITLPTVYISGGGGGSSGFENFDFSSIGITTNPLDIYGGNGIMLETVTITATSNNSDAIYTFYNILDSYASTFYNQWQDQYTQDPYNTPPPPATPPVPVSPTNPCNAAAKAKGAEAYSLYNNTAFTTALSALASHATNSSNEHGFTMNYSNGTYSSSTIVEGSPTKVNLAVSSSSVATIHTHPNGVGPSPGDVYNLGTNGSPNIGYTMGSDGAVYAIAVTDITKFNAFKTANPASTSLSPNGNFAQGSTLLSNFEGDRTGLRYSAGYSEGDASAGALGAILSKKDAGVSIYKLDGGKFKAIGSTKTTDPSTQTTEYNLTKCN